MAKDSKTYTEQELVEGCVANKRLHQELFYRKYFPTMFRMCQRYANNREEALEIVNAGFLRVFQKLHTFSFKGSLEGWVRRLVFHCLADYYRKHDRKMRFLAIEDRDSPTGATPLQNLYFEDIVTLVDKLPNATREVFWLYAVEGYTHAEIGDKLGISSGTSKWHLSNARKKLRELVNQHYYNRNQYAG